MVDSNKQKFITNVSVRDYSKRLYKATNQNYLNNEGVAIFEQSRNELIEKEKKKNSSFPVKS